jgi:hypothetical protein
MCTGATHFHVYIGYHVNSTGLSAPFSTQNESHHFDWRDSRMSRAIHFGVTHFGSKSAIYFPYHLLFFYN